MTTAPTTAGRPREGRLDAAIRTAVVDLVAETGYADLSLSAVAARAATTTAAIYRRWPTKAHLVYDAVLGATRAPTPAGTGELAADLHLVVDGTVTLFATAAARAAVPGLLGEMAADPDLHRELVVRSANLASWQWIVDLLDAAAARGQARAGLDPQQLLETVLGAVVLGVILRGHDGLDDAWVRGLVRQLMAGVAPEAG